MRKLCPLLFLLLLVFVKPTFAHQSGCHRWHSCPSDTGSYTCGDLGYTSGCSGAVQYIPPVIYYSPTPTPTPLQLPIQTDYVLNDLACRYTINAKWQAPSSYTQYSVSAVQTASSQCLDPGPNADTTASGYSFANLPAGRYLVNVKPGNVFGWNYYSYCSEIILPPIKPSVTVSTIREQGQQYIDYKATCATSVRVDNGIGFVNAKQGKLKVSPTGAVTYTLTATGRDGQAEKSLITLSDATPTPLPFPTIAPLPTPGAHKESLWLQLVHFIFGD
jgi:hypothetical protein